ncbi:FAD/NAD(P)-binding protein [Nocardia sp. 2]|uniref:FAD/NAD(P)-binding protein n=1 Tax=Nocardia acididurans TaxID=2802282 RepID=A0ABS1MGL5_9NOCA|nr:FAD/NAD(P)-binding protein [Nocardia acididurans]MBL1078834.1 FAD/NAD(P)-binding protein [Nocardia acididurans]
MTIDVGSAVVQIGRGPTGTALARQLLPAMPPGSRYVVIDRDPAAHQLPFGSPEPTHLINTRAAKSSLNLGDPDEYARWVTEQAAAAGESVTEFPARYWFGRYVRDMFDQAVKEATAAGVTVDVVTDEVVGVRPGRDRRWRVECASGQVFDTHRVVLGIGMLPQADPYPGIAGAAGYFTDPWQLPQLPAEARVAVLGTRLTAVDTALTLAARGHTGPVLLASRSGRLPRLRGPETTAPTPHIEACMGRAAAAGSLRLTDFGRALMADIEAASAQPPDWTEVRDGGPTTRDHLAHELAEVEAGIERGWQQIVNGASPTLLPAWQLLVEPDRAEFFEKWLTPLLVHGAPIPAETARRLVSAMDAGQLRVRDGLHNVRHTGDGFAVHLGDTTEFADVVINATGAGTDAAALRTQPMLAGLLDAGLLDAHPLGGVRVHVPTFEALDRTGTPVPGLHILGDLIRGAVLVTNDVIALSFQAVLLATALRTNDDEGVRPS